MKSDPTRTTRERRRRDVFVRARGGGGFGQRDVRTGFEELISHGLDVTAGMLDDATLALDFGVRCKVTVTAMAPPWWAPWRWAHLAVDVQFFEDPAPSEDANHD